MPNGNKPMYQPWNEDEFTADEIVQAMTPVQKWMYRTLLQKAFTCSTRPDLPNDNSVLWMLAGCENKTQWMENKAIILKKFEVLGLVLRHKRVFSDYQNWSQIIEKRRFAGKMRAEQMFSTCSTDGEQGSKEVSKKGSNISKAQFPETKIAEIWEQTTGKVTEDKKLYRKELRELIRVNGEEAVLSQFETWAALNYSSGFSRPISRFIKQFQIGNITSGATPVKINEINDLAVALSYLADTKVTFNRLNLQGLANLLQEFNQEEIKTAFRSFIDRLENPENEYTAKNFIEQAPQIIRVVRMQKQESARRQEEIERIKTQVQSESASTMATNEAQAAQDETLLGDTIQTFGLEDTGFKSTSNA